MSPVATSRRKISDRLDWFRRFSKRAAKAIRPPSGDTEKEPTRWSTSVRRFSSPVVASTRQRLLHSLASTPLGPSSTKMASAPSFRAFSSSSVRGSSATKHNAEPSSIHSKLPTLVLWSVSFTASPPAVRSRKSWAFSSTMRVKAILLPSGENVKPLPPSSPMYLYGSPPWALTRHQVVFRLLAFQSSSDLEYRTQAPSGEITAPPKLTMSRPSSVVMARRPASWAEAGTARARHARRMTEIRMRTPGEVAVTDGP